MRGAQPSPSQAGSGSARSPLLPTVPARPEHIIDVFVYVVVLNLAIEYLPAVISEGFTLSLLTAVTTVLAVTARVRGGGRQGPAWAGLEVA